MSLAVILLAAGSSHRMKGVVNDKLLMELCGRTLIEYSIQAFFATQLFKKAVVVYRNSEQKSSIASIVNRVRGSKGINISWIKGGKRRQDSVFNGLKVIDPSIETVFIHDCARPLITTETILELAHMSKEHQAIGLAHRIKDTIKRVKTVDSDRSVYRLRDVNRNNLWAMETPQVFSRQLILEAYRTIEEKKIEITDDTAAIEFMEKTVKLLETKKANHKITTPGDIPLLEFHLNSKQKP